MSVEGERGSVAGCVCAGVCGCVRVCTLVCAGVGAGGQAGATVCTLVTLYRPSYVCSCLHVTLS